MFSKEVSSNYSLPVALASQDRSSSTSLSLTTVLAMDEAVDEMHASSPPYQKAIAKAQRLLEMLRVDDTASGLMLKPPRSTTSSDMAGMRDAVQSGYALRARFASDETIDPYADVLATLGSKEISDNIELLWWHNFDTLRDDELCPLTGAMFDNVVNDKAGIIIAVNNFTPAHKAEKKYAHLSTFSSQRPPLPKLKNWLDVAYLQWQSCTLKNDLCYVLRANIHNAETLAMMGHLLGENANNAIIYSPSQSPRGMQRMRPRWPGVVFDMAEEEAAALLGTPNGNGVGWLLIQRKQELGHKVIATVSIFFSELVYGDGDIEEQPNLLFYIQDVNDSGTCGQNPPSCTRL